LDAHWRVDDIDIPKDPDSYNPFLALLDNSDEKKSLLLFSTPPRCAILNKYPYNAGHSLVLPRREIQELQQLTIEQRGDFCQAVNAVIGVATPILCR
jgi:ATP adenylyltransferase